MNENKSKALMEICISVNRRPKTCLVTVECTDGAYIDDLGQDAFNKIRNKYPEYKDANLVSHRYLGRYNSIIVDIDT